jgi:putative ATP-dependent endonuclease of OLD family
MRISRIQIHNFRNFEDLDISLGDHVVIVGENKIGKSNLIHALRLVLDPSLPDSARELRDEDYWDGLSRPLTKDDFITISIDLADFEHDPSQLALLCEHLIAAKPMVSRLTYVFGPISTENDGTPTESDFDFFIYGGDGLVIRERFPAFALSRRNDSRGQTALVTGNEEALGGTQEKEILAFSGT